MSQQDRDTSEFFGEFRHLHIPGRLTAADVQSLVEQLNNIILPDGRKPFTVETRSWANHEIHLKNECSTAVLLFHILHE